MAGIIPLGVYADARNGGNYKISGTASKLGVPGVYPVYLFDRTLMTCLRKVWSSKNGTYQFSYIAHRENGYFLVEFDYGTSPLNAAISDLVTTEPMP